MTACIKDVMTRDVSYLQKSNSLQEASKEIETLNVGAIPVRDREKVVGVLTDRDLVVRGIARGYDPMKTMVGR